MEGDFCPFWTRFSDRKKNAIFFRENIKTNIENYEPPTICGGCLKYQHEKQENFSIVLKTTKKANTLNCRYNNFPVRRNNHACFVE